MLDLVQIEDLVLLDGFDLRSVLDQVSPTQRVKALLGMPYHSRQVLLTKLPTLCSQRLQTEIHASGPISIEEVLAAQSEVLAVLFQLSRTAQIAFDLPEDMVA